MSITICFYVGYMRFFWFDVNEGQSYISSHVLRSWLRFRHPAGGTLVPRAAVAAFAGRTRSSDIAGSLSASGITPWSACASLAPVSELPAVGFPCKGCVWCPRFPCKGCVCVHELKRI